MPTTPTLKPGDTQPGQEKNIGQENYDREFNRIAAAEQQGDFNDIVNNYDKTADPTQEDNNIKNLQNDEALNSPLKNVNTSGNSWANNVTINDEGVSNKFIGRLKKSSPALGIVGVLGIGGFILLALTSPSLLIVQMKETMVGKFNTQLSSMEARSNKLIYSKINGATKGFCNSKITIKCKFSSMSDKQVQKLKAAGIEVIPSNRTSITGRVIPGQLRFNGALINPGEFATMAGRNADFRNALKQAYNPKFAGFSGKAWTNVATRFKITKQAPELNADEDPQKAREKINEISKEGTEDPGSRSRVAADLPECEADGCSGLTDEDAERINSNSDVVREAADDGSAASDVRSQLSGVSAGSTISSFVKITGVIDSACQVYGGMTALSYAGKAIRAAQLVRYAVIFSAMADAIKAGVSPDPEDVALLGGVLTTSVKSSADSASTLVGPATDSYGYKYAAYGDAGASNKSMTIANRFIAGGGFVGEMSIAAASVLSLVGGREGAGKKCRTLANPLVQGASLVLGVASLFIPGANVVKIAVSASASVGMGLIIAVLPGMLADIVAGTVTKDITGEESGNAIASGSGSLMSDALAGQNGNAPMSKEDAIAYNNLQTETNNQYIADELRNTSPFDATNPHTFLGSITAKLIPISSSSNPLTTVGSLLATSAGSLIPTSNALTTEQYEASLDVCKDLDVVEAGYAADPFCNVIRGIPPKYLDIDPILVIDALTDGGDLLEDGTRSQEYEDFVTNCMTNVKPLGYENLDAGFQKDEAAKCVISDKPYLDREYSNAYYYLHYLDQRIELGMSGEDNEEPSSSEPSTVTNTTVDEANLYTDSSSIACATGTSDKGVSTGYKSGKPVTIRICELSNTALSSGGGAQVNARASGVAYSMFEQMRTDLSLEKVAINSSYRTMAEQVAAKAKYGDGAARPGYSNHQMGFAFDINMGAANGGNATGYTKGVNVSYPGNKVWEWLRTNATKYHYSQYAPEGWHWSINGS